MSITPHDSGKNKGSFFDKFTCCSSCEPDKQEASSVKFNVNIKKESNNTLNKDESDY